MRHYRRNLAVYLTATIRLLSFRLIGLISISGKLYEPERVRCLDIKLL